MSDRFKEEMAKIKEKIAKEQEGTKRLLEHLSDPTMLPQPLPEGERRETPKFPLKSPLHYSSGLLDALTEANLPTPIEGKDKKPQAE